MAAEAYFVSPMKCSSANKSFDAVAFMRRRREEIDREDEGLSWEERARKTRELLKDDPLWRYLKKREAEPAPPEPAVVSDKPRHP
jgi:hypothetical protein